MSVLYLTRGIPGSGKSTWAREWVQEDPENRIRLNRDELRQTLFATTETLLSQEQERLVSIAERDVARAALRQGKDVVIDAQNLNPRWVKDWLRLGFPVRFQDFPVDLEEALDRNAQRERPVPEHVIHRAYKRFTDRGALPRPPIQPTPAKVERYVPDETLSTAFLVDIDGTLAHNTSGRSFYDMTRVGEDIPDDTVREVVRSIEMDHHVIVMSGRDESGRGATEAWLREHGIPYDELHMRPAGDQRRDDIVKRELFDVHVRAHWNVLGVIDDRPSVCRMWRSMGLTTLQVGDPHTEF